MGNNDVNKDVFYSKLIEALIKSDYRFNAYDFSKKDIDPSLTVSALKVTRLILSYVTKVHFAPTNFKIHPIFDQEVVQKKLDKIREYGALVCFKYVLAQPIIVTVVGADGLSQGQIVELAHKFDESIIEMLEFTGKIGSTKGSVTGLLLLVFFDNSSASKFDEETQKKCKIKHFWKKTVILPWAINVPAKDLKKHSGMPIITNQLLNTNELVKSIFQ